MTDRLPWFQCFPKELLGALAAMGADEQLVFLTALLRIYEVGGPIDDDDYALSRRTNLTVRRVAAARARLFQNGKLFAVGDRGRYTNRFAMEIIETAKRRVEAISEARSKAASAGHKKRQQDQQNGPANAEQMQSKADAQAEQKQTDKEVQEEVKVEEASKEESKEDSFVPSDDGTPSKPVDDGAKPKKKPNKQDRYNRPYSSEFDRFWEAYPPRAGSRDKKEAWVSFQIITENGTDPEVIISAAKQYSEAERKLDHHNTTFVKLAVTWLNQHCWEDYAPEPAREGTAKTLPWVKVFVGTPQWAAWESHWRKHRGIPPPEIDLRDEAGRIRRGRMFESEFPPSLPAEETKQAA